MHSFALTTTHVSAAMPGLYAQRGYSMSEVCFVGNCALLSSASLLSHSVRSMKLVGGGRSFCFCPSQKTQMRQRTHPGCIPRLINQE